MKTLAEATYNDRLFSSGFRKYLHEARFFWLRRRLEAAGCPARRIVELGCYDGKTLDYLPAPPDYYLGLDANWEDGLTLAQERWSAHPHYEFRLCTAPSEMQVDGMRFDVAVVMETLEHLPEPMVDPYLEKLAAVTDHYAFITVPNEKGIVFFFKYLTKRLFGDAERYTPAEFVNATLGRMHRVQRFDHKGFDYARLIEDVGRHFDVVEVSGIPLPFLPPILSFNVGIVARAKRRPAG